MNKTSDFLCNLAFVLDRQAAHRLEDSNIRHINSKLTKGKAGMKVFVDDGGFVILRKSYAKDGVCIADEGTALERLLTLKRYFAAPEWESYGIFIITKL